MARSTFSYNVRLCITTNTCVLVQSHVPGLDIRTARRHKASIKDAQDCWSNRRALCEKFSRTHLKCTHTHTHTHAHTHTHTHIWSARTHLKHTHTDSCVNSARILNWALLRFFVHGLINTFYIYAFSRCFYRKRLTVHSGYTFFCQYVFPGNRTHNLCAANAMLYHWATGTLRE